MEPVNNNGHPRTGVRYSQVDYNKKSCRIYQNDRFDGLTVYEVLILLACVVKTTLL